MGGKHGKIKMSHPSRDHIDYKFFKNQTGLSREAIDALFEKYLENTDDQVELDRKEFVRLYTKLRPESEKRLSEICEHVFRTFDKDRNGSIGFAEFIVSRFGLESFQS